MITTYFDPRLIAILVIFLEAPAQAQAPPSPEPPAVQNLSDKSLAVPDDADLMRLKAEQARAARLADEKAKLSERRLRVNLLLLQNQLDFMIEIKPKADDEFGNDDILPATVTTTPIRIDGRYFDQLVFAGWRTYDDWLESTEQNLQRRLKNLCQAFELSPEEEAKLRLAASIDRKHVLDDIDATLRDYEKARWTLETFKPFRDRLIELKVRLVANSGANGPLLAKTLNRIRNKKAEAEASVASPKPAPQ